MNKPIKPNITIPQSFAENGVKTDFDDTLLADGFDNLRPDVLAGDNLNKFIDDTYKGLNYGMAAADAINLINEGETLTVVDGKLTSGATGGGGLEICDIGFTQMVVDESKGLRRILNGQLFIQEDYKEATRIIKETQVEFPERFCTESEWQTEVTMSTNGVCYKFVIDDTAGTIRLPKYPNYFIAGLTGNASVVGNGKAIGLTNGTAYQGLVASNANAANHQLVGLTTSAYGANIGQGTSGTNAFTVSQALGLTSDPTKSGVEVKLSNEQAELIKGNYFIQLATGSETQENIINDIELNNPFFFGYYQFFEVAPNNLSWLKSEGQNNPKAVNVGYYEWLNNEKANPTSVPAKANIIEEGILTNRNGVLSGFNTTSCAKLPSNFQPNSNTWEMIFKVTTSNDVVTGQYILALSKGYTTAGRYATRFGLKDSHFTFSVTYNGDAWDIPTESTIGTYTVQANTDYYVKFKYTGSAYVLSYSLDGDIYTEDINVTSSTPTYNDLTACLIGCWSNNGFVSQWLGSIDLNETYININGVRWWSGMKSKVRLHTEDYDDYDWVINREEETFRLPIKTHDVNDSNTELNLYFYVGETVQNANLINAGRVEEKLSDKVDNSNTQWATNACMPDYSAGVSKSSGTYIENYDGILIVDVQNVVAYSNWEITIGGKNYKFFQGYTSVDHNHPTNGVMMIPKNESYTLTLSGLTATLFPLKGAK